VISAPKAKNGAAHPQGVATAMAAAAMVIAVGHRTAVTDPIWMAPRCLGASSTATCSLSLDQEQ
jgi:hypothetical protein